MKKNINLYAAIFFVVNLLLSQLIYAAQIGNKDIEWVTLQTKHFDVIYNKQQQDLGLYYAQIAEKAYSNLSTVFKMLPDKISLVINDSTDSSNGSATVFPYPIINVYPVQIGQQETLSESGEWAHELVTHELTHIAQLYPYSGWPYKIGRSLFGSIISPNLLTPLWWKEGMAVELETQFSNRGRTRSKMQDAQFRSYVLSQKLPQYDAAQANEVLNTWPYGNRPYFFGSLVMNQISKEKGLQSFGQIVEHQSRRIPYAINTPVEELTGFNYIELYEKAFQRYKVNADQQIKNLKSKTPSEIYKIDPTALHARSIQFHPQFNIIGQISTRYLTTEINFYSETSDLNKWKLLELKNTPKGSISRFSFHPLEKKIAFSKTHAINSRENFSDLYIYDLETFKTTDVTEGLRARDPVFSKSGKTLLFTRLNNGKTNLQEIDLQTKKIKPLVNFTKTERLNFYSYKSETEVIYTSRNAQGEQKLFLYNMTDNKSTQIKSEFTDISFIKYVDSDFYFTSAKNGVLNIYQAQLNQDSLTQVKPISHLLTGSLSFDIDQKNKRLFSTLITEDGPHTFISNFKNIDSLPEINNEVVSHYKEVSTTHTQEIKAEYADYSSWTYLYPHYWIPFFGTNRTGDGTVVQAQTSATDPIGNHAYALQGQYDTQIKKFEYLFSYQNSQLPWNWSINTFENQQLITVDTYIKKNNYGITIYPDIFALNENLLLAIGSNLLSTQDDLKSIDTNHWTGFFQTLYSSVEQKVNHYYPMSGSSIGLKYQYFSDLKKQADPRYSNFSQASLSFSTYQNLFFPEDHVLALKINGLYTFEDIAQRFGTSNLGLSGATIDPFLIRGYLAGQFLGTQLITTNLEYHFPIYDILYGPGVAPFYLKYLTGAFVIDGLATKGFGYNKNELYEPLKLDQLIYTAGLELHLNTTLGYVLPFNVILGAYVPTDKKWSKNSILTGLSFQMGGF